MVDARRIPYAERGVWGRYAREGDELVGVGLDHDPVGQLHVGDRKLAVRVGGDEGAAFDQHPGSGEGGFATREDRPLDADRGFSGAASHEEQQENGGG